MSIIKRSVLSATVTFNTIGTLLKRSVLIVIYSYILLKLLRNI